MSTNTAAIRGGRLLEIRADRGYRNAADVDQAFDDLDREVGRLAKAEQHVTVVDCRRCAVMSPSAAARFGERIVLTNGRTHRSAALALQDSPVAVLQFLRVIREAGLPDRKLFFEAKEMIDWLSSVLTKAECRRLATFLSEGGRGAVVAEGGTVPESG
jgi:hypothetical protein